MTTTDLTASAKYVRDHPPVVRTAAIGDESGAYYEDVRTDPVYDRHSKALAADYLRRAEGDAEIGRLMAKLHRAIMQLPASSEQTALEQQSAEVRRLTDPDNKYWSELWA